MKIHVVKVLLKCLSFLIYRGVNVKGVLSSSLFNTI